MFGKTGVKMDKKVLEQTVQNMIEGNIGNHQWWHLFLEFFMTKDL